MSDISALFLWLYNISSFCIRIGMLCYVPLKHEPPTAVAWLLAINIWPWGGLILYSLIGSTGLPRERLRRRSKLLSELGSVLHDLRVHVLSEVNNPALKEDQTRISYMAYKMVDMNPVAGNTVELLSDFAEYLDRLCHDIDNAERYVNLLYYIFAYDDLTKKLFDSLERAAKRGVKCHLLVDSVGSKKFLRRHAYLLRGSGIKVVEVLPIRLLRRTTFTARYDIRNHRKIAVIDGQVAYTGSHNIIEPSYNRKARGRLWRDLSVRLTGPVVIQLLAVFYEDWYVETHEEIPFNELLYFLPHLKTGGSAVLQTVPSGPSMQLQNYQRLVVSALLSAKKTATITTPYFIPDSQTMHAIETARIMDVDVNLVVPERADKAIVGGVARAYFTPLLNMGVNIYLYKGDILHAKTVTIDDRLAFLGTSNFDIRSFALDFEVDLIFYSESEVSHVLETQEMYIANSRILHRSDWEKRPAVEHVVYGITKLFSPLF
jgi:cardiolipin synthase